MVRLSRITTKAGDDGTSSLSDGVRIPKTEPIFEALGAVDEANCALGLARLYATPDIDGFLARLQNDLFDLGADLSTPHEPEGWTPVRLKDAQIAFLEATAKSINAGLEPLNSFVLPAGSPLSAHLHMARALTRRAERAVVAANASSPLLKIYLNRLSDLLFILARDANRDANKKADDQGFADALWVPFSED